jgi:hypothetical protein
MNDLLIEMCLVFHNLRRQITLLLKSWVNPGSPGHRSQFTLQHTEAYRVTRAQEPGHPPTASLGPAPVRPVTVTGQTSDHRFTPFW